MIQPLANPSHPDGNKMTIEANGFGAHLDASLATDLTRAFPQRALQDLDAVFRTPHGMEPMVKRRGRG